MRAKTIATATSASDPTAALKTPAERVLGLPPLQPGPVPGYLMIADRNNDRIIILNPQTKQIVWRFPRPGDVRPGQSFQDPDDAFFAPGYRSISTNEEYNQTMSQIEIGGWVDRISKSGRLVYTVRTPTAYPSDAQLLPDGNILVAGFDTPGRVDEINPSGRIVWTFAPTGYWSLDRPSLAERWPNGMIAVSDDWHHRVLVIDPKTKQVVWSYGHLDHPGSAPGYLSKPDGLDLLPAVPQGAATTRTTAKASDRLSRGPAALRVTRIGALPQALSKAAAVALPGGRLMLLGGEAGGSSVDTILLGQPGRLRVAGHLLAAGHDAAAVLVGGKVLLLGGGQAASVTTVTRVDPGTAKAVAAPALDEPLSDLGAVAIGGSAYLVGGYTGSQYASAILRYLRGGARRRLLVCPPVRATRAWHRSGARSTWRAGSR